MRASDPAKSRAYFFGNLYISQIQHGIQGSHAVTKMFRNNQPDLFDPDYAMVDNLNDWADFGLTKIYLQAGFQRNLEVIHDVLSYICPRLRLPYAKFHEEDDALNGALTSVCVVVPEEVYNMDMAEYLNPVYGMLRDIKTPTDVYNTVRRLNPESSLYKQAMAALLNITIKSAKLA